MSEDAASLAKRSHGVSKFLSKDRWREKKANVLASGSNSEPLAKDKHDVEDFTLAADVVDFLKPSTSKPPTTKLRPVSPKAPRIDIAAAQKWASSAAAGGQLPTPSSLRKKDYPRRALHLAVSFTNNVPEVIGEGGDEAEEPVIEISKRLEESGQRTARAPPPLRPAADGSYFGNDAAERFHADVGEPRAVSATRDVEQQDLGLDPPPSIQATHARNNSFPTDEPDFVPKPIQRTQTRFGNLEGDNENVRPSIDSASIYSEQSSFTSVPASANPLGRRESYQLPVLNSVMDDSPLGVTQKLEDLHFGGKRASLSSPILQEKIQQMYAEEGQALHSAVEQDPFVDNFANTNRLSSSTTSSYRADPGEVAHQRSFSSSRINPPPQYTNIAQYQPQESPMPSVIPLQAVPTPDVHPRTMLPSRKAVGPPHDSTQHRPISHDSATSQPAQQSPALNVMIPHRAEYFQPPTVTGRPLSNSAMEPARSWNPGVRPQDPSPRNSAGPIDSYPPSRSPSGATPGAALGQLALDDFADRCSHMSGIFRLQAEFERPIYDFTPSQWLRAASWWFLRGRAGIELLVRDQSRSSDGKPHGMPGQELLSQPHVDLAKAWWIMMDIIPSHPACKSMYGTGYAERSVEARRNGDHFTGDLFESCDILMTNMKGIFASMKRNGVMPPTHALIQGQDQTIWLKYPDLAPSLLPILSGASGRSLTEGGNFQTFNPLSVIGVADTWMDFSYNRMFVKASLGIDNDNVERLLLPCIVSVMRERNDWQPKVTICSQKELVTICITGDRRRGPSWQDVRWSEQQRSLHVLLPHGYSLNVQLSEPDFRQLFQTYNHTFRVQSSLLPRQNETVVYEVSLSDFQYRDSHKATNPFPPDRIKRCRIRVFEKTETKMGGNGERKLYRGLRLLAVTSPKTRTLGCASHDVGIRYPTVLTTTSDTQNPSLPCATLYVQEDRRQCSLLMVFNDAKDYQGLLNILNGSSMRSEECSHTALRLRGLNIEPTDQGDALTVSPHNPFTRMQWKNVHTINWEPATPQSGFDSIVASESLRVISQATEGTITDRINLGPGELLLRLSPDGQPNLTLFRQAQEDLSITVDPTKSSQHLPNELADIQRTAFMLPTIRTFSFFSHEDLHKFQSYITNFMVTYDGLAAAFTIARRRPVTALSKHKRLEAGSTRLQIVAHERQRTIQLLAFFDDLPQAEALNFQLKGVDVFERYEDKRSRGRYGVKLVDAKFTLPIKEKGDRDERGRSATPDGKGRVEQRFVNLDMLEPPAENDDIVIGFEEEQEREKFLQALPAPPQVHRGLTLKRRI